MILYLDASALVKRYTRTHNLRGFDAVHLAAALTWQDALDARVTLATFDRCLWAASQEAGLEAYPPDLSALLKRWKSEG